MKRIKTKFAELKKKNHCAFIGYICAGDPDYTTALELLKSMPQAGVDLIELGVPFLDPAGDGPIIENAAKRAVHGDMTLAKTLQMVAEFRKTDQKTPLILMSYYNPILKYGLDKIFVDAATSGVDGFLIVDLPLEEEAEIKKQINQSNLDLIHLFAPTTSQDRAQKIAKTGSGFAYMISMLGITGTRLADLEENKKNLQKLRQISHLPIAIGFGIKTPTQAQEFSKIGVDGVIVGSAIVEEINNNFLAQKNSAEIVVNTINLIGQFAKKIKS